MDDRYFIEYVLEQFILPEWWQRGEEEDLHLVIALIVWPNPNGEPEVLLNTEVSGLVFRFKPPGYDIKLGDTVDLATLWSLDLTGIVGVSLPKERKDQAFILILSRSHSQLLKFHDLTPLAATIERWFPNVPTQLIDWALQTEKKEQQGDLQDELEQLLNARSEEERERLFRAELDRLAQVSHRPDMPPSDWTIPIFEGEIDGKKQKINTEKIFADYNSKLDVLQAFAEELTADPVHLPSSLIVQVDGLLFHLRLSVAQPQGVVLQGVTPDLESAAFKLWQIHAGIADFTLKRCKWCQRLIIDRSRGRKRETCGTSCRSRIHRGTVGYKRAKKKKKGATEKGA